MKNFKAILAASALTLGLGTAAQAASVIPQGVDSFDIEFQWSDTPYIDTYTGFPLSFNYDLSFVSYTGAGSDQSGYYFDVDGARLTTSNTSACAVAFGDCDLINTSTAPGVLFSNLAAGTTFELGVYDSATPTFGKVTFNISKAADVAPVPLPAAGLLLLGALGGIAGMRKRKKAA
jgi:hypothetical protein